MKPNSQNNTEINHMTYYPKTMLRMYTHTHIFHTSTSHTYNYKPKQAHNYITYYSNLYTHKNKSFACTYYYEPMHTTASHTTRYTDSDRFASPYTDH